MESARRTTGTTGLDLELPPPAVEAMHGQLSTLADDVVATDQGQTFRGRDEVIAFVRDAGSEFEYTTEEIGARRVDDSHYVIGVRLEGDFPGGVAELDYRFTLRDDLITEIVIGDHERE